MRRLCWAGTAKIRSLLYVVVIGGLSIGSGPQCVAHAAEGGESAATALKLIPEQALGAIFIGNLAKFDEKLTTVVAKLHLPISENHLTAGKKVLGIQEDCIKDDGAALLVLLPSMIEGSKTPLPVLAVPVTSYENFIGNFAPAEIDEGFSRITLFGQELWAIRKQGHAWIFSPRDFRFESDEAQLAHRQRIKKLLVDRPAELAPSVAASKEWLVKQDVGIYASTDGMKLGMGAARAGIQFLKTTVAEATKMAADGDEQRSAMLGSQMQTAIKAFELYDQMFAWIEREVSEYVGGLRIEDDATLRLASRTRFNADSGWKQFAGKLPAPTAAPLTGLAKGPYMAAFEGTFTGSGSNFLTDYSLQMFKVMELKGGESKLTDADWKRMGEAMQKSMEGVRSMAMVVGVPAEGKSLYAGMTGFVKVDDSAKYLKNYETSISALQKLTSASKNPFMGEYKIAKTEVDGTAGLELTVDFSQLIAQLEAQQKNAESMKAYFDLMVGPDGKMSTYIVPVDQHTVVMAWIDKENLNRAKAALESAADSLSADEGVKATAAKLGKGSQWVAFLNPAGTAQFIGAVMQAMGAGNLKLPDLGEAPPVGFAAHLEGDALETEVVLPGSTVDSLGKALHPER